MDGMTALPLLLRADPGAGHHGLDPDHARRRHRPAGARGSAPPTTSRSPHRRRVGDDSFRRELVEKVKGLARQRRRAAARRAHAGHRSRLPSGTALRARSCSPSAARPAGRRRCSRWCRRSGTSLQLPVVMTQHMPATFMPILADISTRLGGMPCAEARDGESLQAGRIYLAPGDRHLLVEGGPAAPRAAVEDPPENFCRPSVDPMLRSAAEACGGRVLTAMLTGMGHDGLAGTRQVIEAGGGAIAQDEATSVVWGMPGAIAQAGLCHAVLPLPQIAPRICSRCCGWRTHERSLPGVVRDLRHAAQDSLRPGDRAGQALPAGNPSGPIVKAERLRDLDALADRLRRPGTERAGARRRRGDDDE